MKAILTLATLLSITTPSMASLSGSYNTQATAEREWNEQCKVYHKKAQYQAYDPFGTKSNGRYFVRRDGAVVLAELNYPFNNSLICNVVGYVNQTTKCMGDKVLCKKVITSVEWKREGQELVRYNTNSVNSNIVRSAKARYRM
jgi:hypothetical protein